MKFGVEGREEKSRRRIVFMIDMDRKANLYGKERHLMPNSVTIFKIDADVAWRHTVA